MKKSYSFKRVTFFLLPNLFKPLLLAKFKVISLRGFSNKICFGNYFMQGIYVSIRQKCFIGSL